MKTIKLLAVCMLALFAAGCTRAEEPAPEAPAAGTVIFVNEVTDTDVWILADTEENRKTTVWGTPAVRGLKVNTETEAQLCEPAENGLYLIRMISAGKMYFSADDVVLEDGWTIRFRVGKYYNDHPVSWVLEVTDTEGNPMETYEVFGAAL
ncbi:MAG: hypothetical protein IIY53_07090 [Solobacterium sp.]|nr:hypothetical protein [Solobacterium sp.]MBQ1321387.1 hypothetical protein [Solobacterium sp.]